MQNAEKKTAEKSPPTGGSKTQELRDWLDAKINDTKKDIRGLGFALGQLSQFWTMSYLTVGWARYGALTSDELEAKVAEDRKKLEELKERLKLLCSARELDVDIDGIEECLGTEVSVDYHKPFNKIYFPVSLSFVVDKEVCTRVHYFPLAQREIRINQHVGDVYVDNHDCCEIVGCELTDGLQLASPYAKTRCLQIELTCGFLRIFDSGRVSFSQKRDGK